MEEFIFPSHTSIISTELIVEKMQEQGMDVGQLSKKSVVKKEESDVDSVDSNQCPETQNIHLMRASIRSRSYLREMTLEKEFVAEAEEQDAQPLRRVLIEALDFDWIFQGDNALIFLGLLANKSND